MQGVLTYLPYQLCYYVLQSRLRRLQLREARGVALLMALNGSLKVAEMPRHFTGDGGCWQLEMPRD